MSKPFDRHHDEDALAARLEALGRAVPASSDLTQRVMNQIRGAKPARTSNPHIRRWIMRGGIGLAASVLIGTFLWTQFVAPPRRAYGIEDAREQLGKVNSLYVKGKGQDGSPWEVFVERPNRCYRVQAAHRITQTPEKNMVIDERNKVAVITPGDALDARFLTEEILQTELFTQLLGPPDQKMKKVRTERVGDVDADVYERRDAEHGMRREVMLNPKSGIPVKSVLYMKDGNEPEVALATIDHIEANGPAPAGAFDFAVPEGYTRQQLQAVAPQQGAPAFNAAIGDSHHLELSYNLDIGDGKAALICWSLYDEKHPRNDMDPRAAGAMKLTGSKSGYVEHLLRADEMPDGHHWRWSLVLPTDPKTLVADNPLTMTVKTRSSTLSFTLQPVKLSHEELATFIVAAQRRTLPEGGKPMTLADIEQRLAELAAKRPAP